MNLAVAFADSVKKRPEKTAMFWGESEFTYGALLAQAQVVAQRLAAEFNVKPGDRVGLWLKNRPEFVPAFFGILNAGAVVVPINNFLKPDEVSYILQDAGIDVLITDADLGAHFPALAAARPALKVLKVEEFEQQTFNIQRPTSNAQRPPTEADLAVIIYTSGTTGRPKGAMLSHGNLLHNVESCRILLETVELDRFAVLLPLFHSYMMTVGMLLPLLVGGSMVLVKSLNQPHNILKEICQRQATILPAIPQFYRTLTHAPIPGAFPFRLCISGAAPLPVQVLKDFEAKFKVPLIEGYGLSEASPVVTKNPLRGVRKPGSIGLPIPHVEVSVQDDGGRMLGANENGEICVRGSNVMLGYWNQPEATAQAIRSGWLLTGDIGYRDNDGYYFITDRKKDMLLVNGINVYPREIEEVLYQFPGVKEVAVVGWLDARRGEMPVAFVVPSEGVTLDERALIQFARLRLADYKVPKRVNFMPALPRNATGKILKTALRNPATEL
ncbi:MAG: long-chain fatty acid--CoA ligase [Verrucomicrobia bacterium]|jgi:long-chain acyl-CoA synthetase|nr:long-chain fatty acid--CoA ligase [Verrucomicrobiota bacterium]